MFAVFLKVEKGVQCIFFSGAFLPLFWLGGRGRTREKRGRETHYAAAAGSSFAEDVKP